MRFYDPHTRKLVYILASIRGIPQLFLVFRASPSICFWALPLISFQASALITFWASPLISFQASPSNFLNPFFRLSFTVFGLPPRTLLSVFQKLIGCDLSFDPFFHFLYSIQMNKSILPFEGCLWLLLHLRWSSHLYV